MMLEIPSPVLSNIRLVATDMDGTLTQQGRFTPEVLSALTTLAEAGIAVVIVTGRSAGWVQGLATYLPIAGAIAENGGIFCPSHGLGLQSLTPLPDIFTHRQALETTFQSLQTRYPQLQPSGDNPFRLTDWTFDITGLSTADLAEMGTACQEQGWDFIYSTVQCHIRPQGQDKGPGLATVLAQHFPHLTPQQVLTVGDSPNDVGLFDPAQFPHSVGVANVIEYRDRLSHFPAYVTPAAEGAGFCQVAAALKGGIQGGGIQG